jgi:hypothetical protein
MQPEKSLLVFLWYLSKQDTLLAIADRFDLVPSMIMQIHSQRFFIHFEQLKKSHFLDKNDGFSISCIHF